MQATERSTYIVFGPRVSEASKQAIRDTLGVPEIPADFGPFGSGAPFCELFPLLKPEREKMLAQDLAARFDEKRAMLNGAHVIFVESTGEQPGVADSVERVRFAVNSLKEYGAAEVTLAMPNVAYERQDRGFNEQGRLCSLGSQWLARDLKRYGADRVITCASHSQAVIDLWGEQFGKENYLSLPTTELFTDHIRAQFADASKLVIGAPDGADKPNDRGIARAQELAAAVRKNLPMFKIGKAHVGASETTVTSFEGDVSGKDCVVIDDMSDGGSTLINAAKELKAHGAKSVSVYFTHAVCSKNSLSELASRDAIDRIVTTDTVPEIIAKRDALTPALQQKVSILPVGQLLAASLKTICQQQPGSTIGGPINSTTHKPQQER